MSAEIIPFPPGVTPAQAAIQVRCMAIAEHMTVLACLLPDKWPIEVAVIMKAISDEQQQWTPPVSLANRRPLIFEVPNIGDWADDPDDPPEDGAA
jgi:hypothetical protein